MPATQRSTNVFEVTSFSRNRLEKLMLRLKVYTGECTKDRMKEEASDNRSCSAFWYNFYI